jgi:hypothetical protein
MLKPSPTMDDEGRDYHTDLVVAFIRKPKCSKSGTFLRSVRKRHIIARII